MIILHIAPINTTRVNGFRFSVPGLVSAQENMGLKVALLNVEKQELYREGELEKKGIKIFHGKVRKLHEIEEPFNNPDIVIFHGVYKVEYLGLSKQLKKREIPYVIVPRVSLTEGAQRQKALKKKLSNSLFFNKFIKGASAIQYLTNNERKLSQNFQHNNFVVGNGIDMPDLHDKTIKNPINLCFIGRYDINHKGLDVLILALNSIKEFLRKHNVKVNLYGSDYKNGKQYLLDAVKNYELEDCVSVYDAVFGIKKEVVFNNTDVFIATSRSEGHPMAVIEAMSYGIPSILTEGTNMQDDLIKYNAGWEANLTPESIAESIVKAIESPLDAYYKGLNARKLIEKKYTWERVANSSVTFYKNIISRD